MLLPAAAPGVLPRRAAGRVRWGLPEAEMRALTGLQGSGAGCQTWQWAHEDAQQSWWLPENDGPPLAELQKPGRGCQAHCIPLAAGHAS